MFQDNPNFIWKTQHPKDVATLIDLFNFVHGDADELPGHNYIQHQQPWLRTQRSTTSESRYSKTQLINLLN